MKQFSFLICLLFCLGTTESLSAQKKDKKLTKKEQYNLGYAFGAQMGKSLKAATMLTEDERNVDKFIEGFTESLKGDPVTLAKGQEVLQGRIQSQTESATPEAGGQIAYSIGLTSGLGQVAEKVEISARAFNLKGVKAGYVDGMTKEEDALKMNQEEIELTLKTYLEPKFEEYQEIIKAENEAKATESLKEGEAFLATNKKKKRVITTASGLQYEIIKEGSGAKPTLEDNVKTHYHATLIDGTVFDSSVDRDEPATFPLGGVIPGWQEGIRLMSEGAKYRFYIPQNLGYGMQSPTPAIPPGSVLIFDVELLEVNPE
jgi:FKBP-type peptidyl-prolyl cis-trans isomerase FklB